MIVSGDNDLLSLGTYSGISLLSPAEYLRQRAAAAKPG
jgi:predicted nucleic acid-binding protein